LLRERQKRRVSLSNEANQSIGHRRRASSQIQASMQINNVPTIAETPKAVAQSETKPHPNPSNDSAHSQTTKPVASEETKTSASDDIGDLEKSMSALRFVPTSVVLRNSKKS
jgi:hypothetical protein